MLFEHRRLRKSLFPLAAAGLLLLFTATSAYAQTRTYTTDGDFDEGTLININHDSPNSDQLQLNDQGEPFEFLWVAASGRGTVLKIDTRTGMILGEYLSAPDGRGRDPSRTTVDANGNVWAGNRAEASGGQGSVIHIGLLENGQCEDRNDNHVIDTSSGLGDIMGWTNPGGVNNAGGVSSADDECIIHYLRTTGTHVRTLAVDSSNQVWIGGYSNKWHELCTSNGMLVPGSQFNLGCGGYGGLVDQNGVLWSARELMRRDPTAPPGSCIPGVPNSYGLGEDSFGHIWNSQWTNNTITKLNSAGGIIGVFPTGGSGSRGVAVTADDNIWVANSISNTVTRLANNGALLATVPVGNHPTGVSVDAAGKVWVTNYISNDAMRIDPATNAVDMTVYLGAGASPYNYSDMTGAAVPAAPTAGNWTVVFDSGIVDQEWGFVDWTADTPSDALLAVTAASSTDGTVFGPFETVSQATDLSVANGRYLKVSVQFTRATTLESPVLYDLTITGNQPPDCTQALPSEDKIWPPNHAMVPIEILGVTDPDGDPVSIVITGITQDEPLDDNGDGHFEPDGEGIGTDTAWVRAERMGPGSIGARYAGNGRVYEISFLATDDMGGECEGSVQVCVPHDRRPGSVCTDDGQLYDSTGVPFGREIASTALTLRALPNPFNPTTLVSYTLPTPTTVRVDIYDIAGRSIQSLVDRRQAAGDHSVEWNATGHASGVYFLRLEAGNEVEVARLTLSK